MASNAWWAYGSQFKIGDGATPEVFTAVAEVMDIPVPPLTRESIRVTNQDSDDGYHEDIPGWRDGGSVTFSMNWLPSDATQDGSTGLFAQFNDNANHNYQLVTPTAVGKTISFSGHITNFAPTMPLNEQGKLDVTIKMAGPFTIA